MNTAAVIDYISHWLANYCNQSGLNGFIVGISGGIDSAVTSTLCARTGLRVIALNMPIHQHAAEYDRSVEHIAWLEKNYHNVRGLEVDLSRAFDGLLLSLPQSVREDKLSMANTRARLRMTTLYAIGQNNRLLVAGTGNKVEDFGIGFFTKYGDGGVDISPIADLMKSEVYALAAGMSIVDSIMKAPPTDGLWADGRNDHDQIGASYDELEWAMQYSGDETNLSVRQKEVLGIYRKFRAINLHKMDSIPVCRIDDSVRAAKQ
jgi:NAD+ synthase